MSWLEKLYKVFHNIWDVSKAVFIQKQLAITAQGNKMFGILSLKCEKANNVHVGEGE
jgi:hypothetical protein